MILALLQFTMLTLAVYIGLLCYAHKTRRRRTYLIWFDLASVLIAALSIIVFLSGKEQSRALELLRPSTLLGLRYTVGSTAGYR